MGVDFIDELEIVLEDMETIFRLSSQVVVELPVLGTPLVVERHDLVVRPLRNDGRRGGG